MPTKPSKTAFGKKKTSTKKKRVTPARTYLKKKIAINIAEYKNGRYSSVPQAIAVAYSQTKKKFPRSNL